MSNGAELQGTSLNGEVLNGPGTETQGPVLNGPGTETQGPRLEGHTFENATLQGMGLSALRVESGELVAELNGLTLRGTQLTGAVVRARMVEGQTITLVSHRISAITPELPAYERGPEGSTFLYTVERLDPATGAWSPMCSADKDGAYTAIPVSGVWDAGANRVESASAFTFACTSGAIGKCYRWGYRPWLAHPDGPQVMKDAHQACVRLTRADYCGDGRPHTQSGTRIMIWDTLTTPGPFQTFEAEEGNHFEAAWTPAGAVCLSHPRWIYPGQGAWVTCADRPLLPCTNTHREWSQAPVAGAPRLFTESGLNVAL